MKSLMGCTVMMNTYLTLTKKIKKGNFKSEVTNESGFDDNYDKASTSNAKSTKKPTAPIWRGVYLPPFHGNNFRFIEMQTFQALSRNLSKCTPYFL